MYLILAQTHFQGRPAPLPKKYFRRLVQDTFPRLAGAAAAAEKVTAGFLCKTLFPVLVPGVANQCVGSWSKIISGFLCKALFQGLGDLLAASRPHFSVPRGLSQKGEPWKMFSGPWGILKKLYHVVQVVPRCRFPDVRVSCNASEFDSGPKFFKF